jgi:hypothetical protein
MFKKSRHSTKRTKRTKNIKKKNTKRTNIIKRRKTLKGSGKKEKGQYQHITSLAKSTIPFSYATLGYPRIGRDKEAAEKRQTKIRTIFNEKRDIEAAEDAKEAAKELLATKRKWFADSKIREKVEREIAQAERDAQYRADQNAEFDKRQLERERQDWNANSDTRAREALYRATMYRT